MTLRATANDILTMAATVYGEARGSTHADRVAVAWVIRNRAERAAKGDRAKMFGGGTLAGACRAVEGARWKQFSCWNDGDPNRPRLDRLMADPVAALDDPIFRRCLAAVLAVIEGLEPDPTEGSTHYHTTAMGFPRTWGPVKAPVGVIGAHAFYNDVA